MSSPDSTLNRAARGRLCHPLSVIHIVLLLAPLPCFCQQVAQGKFNNATYLAVAATNGITWTAAEAKAVALGGHLASITSLAEDRFIYSLASASPLLWVHDVGGHDVGPWLGGQRSTGATSTPPPPGLLDRLLAHLGYARVAAPQTGPFCWSDGSPFTYSNWAPGEPNGYGGTENRVSFFSNSGSPMADTWNDSPDDTTGDTAHAGVPNPHGFIVEIPAHSLSTTLVLAGLALLLLGVAGLVVFLIRRMRTVEPEQAEV